VQSTATQLVFCTFFTQCQIVEHESVTGSCALRLKLVY
jgi:hypothetical protein